MFVERNPDKMEDNIRRMGNYLKLYRCTLKYISQLYIFFKITCISTIHGCLFFLGQGEEKSICILHPRWPSGNKYLFIDLLVISKL